MTRRRMLATLFVSALVGLALGRTVLGPGAGDPRDYAVRTELIMATSITIEAPADQIDRAAEITFEIFRGVDARMSEWKDTSPLSALNKAAGAHPVPVPDDLREILRRSVEIGRLTDGAFDITWAALWGLWDFNAESPRPPPDDAIAARLPLIDFRLVQIDDHAGTVFLPKPGMLLGLGGIAKGHALDRAADALGRAGIDSFLLSAGGQVLVGEPRRGASARPWRIGIRDPRGPADDCFATIDLANTGISTSGDYEKFFIADGARYHHILDPRTGRPSRTVRSVAVITPDATLGDALSTALMILDVSQGLAIVDSLPDVEAVLIDAHGQLHLSSGVGERRSHIHPPHPGEPHDPLPP